MPTAMRIANARCWVRCKLDFALFFQKNIATLKSKILKRIGIGTLPAVGPDSRNNLGSLDTSLDTSLDPLQTGEGFRRLRQGEIIMVYMKFDRHASKSLSSAEYLLAFGAAVSAATVEANSDRTKLQSSAHPFGSA